MAEQPSSDRWWEAGKGLIGLANLQRIVLWFQQVEGVLSGSPFNPPLAFSGIFLWFGLYSLALISMKGGNKKQ